MLPTPRPPGLLEAIVGGYHLAWTNRSRLLASQAPVLAAMTAGFLLLDLSGGREHTMLLDGVINLDDGASKQAWARAALGLLCGLLALVAGILALAGPDPDRPVRTALGRMPMLVSGLILTVGVAFVVLWVLHNMAGAVLFAGIVAVVSARLLVELVVPKPRWTATAPVLLGGFGLALGLGWLSDRLVPQFLTAVAGVLILTIVLAATAGVIAIQAEPRKLDAAPKRAWPAVAALAVPLLLGGGVAVANPIDAPVVRTHAFYGLAPQVLAWPEGSHPVIVTIGGVRFCDTDLCDRFTGQTGGPALWDDYGTAGIGPDGTVVKAAITGGEDDGGPFADYVRCTRDGCPRAWVPVRASGKDKIDGYGGPVELAANAAPDGATWLFVAVPVPGNLYRLSLIRCQDTPCTAPQRHDAGTIRRTPADRFKDGRRARLSIGADGRPVASLWIGHSLRQVTCDPVTCANRRTVDVDAGPPDAVWPTPVEAGQPVLSLERGLLRRAADEVIVTQEMAPKSGALAVGGSTVYVTGAVTSERPSTGFSVTIGEQPEYWRQVLWQCGAIDCRRTPLDVFEGPAQRELIAVGPGGRVLIARDDRTVLVDNL
ncbi:hypothetical protein [Actinoplanes sp. GCM10030250]|uniref:hypothetical protein n=1 Tax=Actinoplanes sp. GCM10030250 TaxID=3273376 RepID=UPI00360FE9D5